MQANKWYSLNNIVIILIIIIVKLLYFSLLFLLFTNLNYYKIKTYTHDNMRKTPANKTIAK